MTGAKSGTATGPGVADTAQAQGAGAPDVRAERGCGYAGEVDVEEAWRILAAAPRAVLVDVRTRAEWAFVGAPDLEALHKTPVFCQWQTFSGDGATAQATDFAPDLLALLAQQGTGPNDPVFFLCRSGGRSRAAAKAMTEQGHARCFNVTGGFEGDRDDGGHRGRVSGWKARGLPWRQK